ncbi:MAG TPA: phosphoglycerate dehydrogenase [Firmicutes bacterium]|nr:phosphoglycerate dehydrogenase [Bacillota bacterium]
MRILVADPISEQGIERLRQSAQVDVATKLKESELVEKIRSYDALIVRSETKVTQKVLEAGRSLKVVGRAGVGVDNIDVEAATRLGIVVVNAPSGNTLAAAEHTVAMMMALCRNIPQADASVRRGEWTRSKFLGVELHDKTLGIIGLGRVGFEVARIARGLEMHVLAHDPFVSHEKAERLGVQMVSLEELLKRSDFITVHTPLTDDSRNLIGPDEIELMKPGVRIVNCARGGIVNEAALADAIVRGKVAGAALDVFEHEPVEPTNPLLSLPKVIVTPHLGASTEEAQINVAISVVESVLAVLRGELVRDAVNLPRVSAQALTLLTPYVPLAEKLGKMHAQLLRGQIRRINVVFSADLGTTEMGPLTSAVLKGFLRSALQDSVNAVNAPIVARERGIHVSETLQPPTGSYTSLLEVWVESSEGSQYLAGTLLGKNEPRLVRIDGYVLDAPFADHMLLIDHVDRPGVIGKIGTILGSRDINISGMQVGRKVVGGDAIMVLGIDMPADKQAIDEIARTPNVISVKVVNF